MYNQISRCKAVRTLIYFKLDKSLAHSSLISHTTVKYIWISQVGEWMKCMFNLTDTFVAGRTSFTQIIVSFLVDKKYKCLSLTGS